jgi:hypothetical protein
LSFEWWRSESSFDVERSGTANVLERAVGFLNGIYIVYALNGKYK